MAKKDVLAYIFGFILVTVSMGVGLVYSFKANFPVVFLGFIGFTAGYKISQTSLEGRINRQHIKIKIKSIFKPRKILMSLIGSGIMTYGFITISRSIIQASPSLGLLGGSVILIGYFVSHKGVNKVMI